LPFLCFCSPGRPACGSRTLSADSRQNGGQISASDARQIRYRQRENRGAEDAKGRVFLPLTVHAQIARLEGELAGMREALAEAPARAGADDPALVVRKRCSAGSWRVG
jgi:hypothetical protein